MTTSEKDKMGVAYSMHKEAWSAHEMPPQKP